MKDRIIKSTVSLFWRLGIKSVTMDDIASCLGISKRTIYQHFPDKEAILLSAVEQELAQQENVMKQLGNEFSNPIDEMLQASEQLRVCMSNINPAFLHDLRKYYPSAWKLMKDHKNDFVMQKLLDNLTRGKNEGLYRSDINTEILAKLRIEQVEIAFDTTVFPQEKYSLMDLQFEFVHHFLRGILTEKGFKHYNTIQTKSEIEYVNP